MSGHDDPERLVTIDQNRWSRWARIPSIPLTEAHTPFFDLLKQGIERILSFRQGRLVVFGSNADAAELGLGHDGFPLSETSPGAVGNTLAGLPKPSEAQ